MSYSTFNGNNIIPMPATPGFKDFSLEMNDSVGQTISPFSSSQQEQYWASADVWTLSFTMPPMDDQTARPWMAWSASLRGRLNVFPCGDPNYQGPYGAVTGTPQFNGGAAAAAYTVNVKNLTPSTNNIFEPGDRIGLGVYMHIVAGVGPYNSDSSGHCTIEIFPSLRQSFGDGNNIGIHTNDTTGLFRLADNKRVWSADADTRLWTFAVKAVEARI